MKVAEAAELVMRDRGASTCWYGDPDLIQEIAERAGVKARHPLSRSAAVVGALARSPRFTLAGYIRHLGHRYPVYQLASGSAP